MRQEFTMDPNLLVSVIKSQAGSLSKAILEGVMNSIDARASRVDVTLDAQDFVISDNGQGFANRKQIDDWFGRFGTPHREGDAIYGRFRMGRGQLMAFASTRWRSGRFQMSVDIEGQGMGFDLLQDLPAVRGCRIEGHLYHALSGPQLADVLTELRQLVAYALKPVYVNGELFGAPAQRLKSWTFEDELAYYRLSQDQDELQVYNQGVFVETMGSWKVGMGGVVVSKQALQVNFARNSILENRCEVWRSIARRLESLVVEKLHGARKLSDSERKFLARRLELLPGITPDYLSAKILTDPSGRHIPLGELKRFRQFVLVEDNEALACAVHGAQGTFVATPSLLERFGVYTLSDWLRRLQAVPGLLPSTYDVVEQHRLSEWSLGTAQTLSEQALRPRQHAAFVALGQLNEALGRLLMAQGVSAQVRELRLGHHRSGKFVAWTDGKSFISANKAHLKLFAKGIDGVHEWLLTLVHEYMHDTDDSESHSHSDVFYRKFHDVSFSVYSGSVFQLIHAALQRYVEELHLRGLGRPRHLVQQLKGVWAPQAKAVA